MEGWAPRAGSGSATTWSAPLSEAASYLAPSVGQTGTTALLPDQLAEITRGDAAELEQRKDWGPPDVVSVLTPAAAALRTRTSNRTISVA